MLQSMLPDLFRARFGACLTGCVLIASCRSNEPAQLPELAATGASTATASAEQRPASRDSAQVAQAEGAVRRWLDASLEPAPDAPLSADVPAWRQADLIADCPDGAGAFFPSMLLADYTLLPSTMRGDTVVARASVVTVAEQDIDRRQADHFVARVRVRRDQLEWDVVPRDDDTWAVCNGLRFGYRGADSLTTWRPESRSLHDARVLADSLRRATRTMPPASERRP
jgi:hypothetical protein